MHSPLVETSLEAQLFAAQTHIEMLEQQVRDLRDREQLLKIVLDAIPVRVFWKDVNIDYLGGNRLLAQDAGVASPEELVGLTDYDMVWAPYADIYRADDRAVIDSGVAKINFEEPQVNVSGEVWLRTSKVPLRNAEGTIIGMLGSYEDITEYKRAEIELRNSRQQLLAVMNNAPLILYALDADGIFVLSEGRGLLELGLQPGQIVGQSVYDVYSTFPTIIEAHQRAYQGEAYQYFADVGTQQYETWLIPQIGTDGKVEGMVGVAVDISQRAQAERERDGLLRRTEHLLNLSQDLTQASTTHDIVTAVLRHISEEGNSTATLSYIDLDSDQNPAKIRMMATTNPTSPIPLGTSFDLTTYPSSDQWINNPYTSFVVEDTLTDMRLDETTRDIYRAFDLRANVLVPLYQNNRWVATLSIYWDTVRTFTDEEQAYFAVLPSILTPVVDNLRLIEQLEENLEQLEFANAIATENARLKSEFLATMSHELRTPLNAIEGFTSVSLSNMGGVEYNDRTQHYVERVNANSKRLLALINDFLDLSRIESGRLQLAHAAFAPRALAQQWEEQLSVLAQNKGIAIEVHVDPTLPDTLYGDEEQLSRVMSNLLGNAIKFTDEGSVTLNLRYQGTHWEVQVRDTGIGIPPHASEFIFEEFRQIDSSSKRKYGGTGLGLAIVQKLVRAMQGTITLQSDLGEGSTFTVTLPVSSA